MNLAEKFPPLYQCENCGKAVSVTGQGVGVEPLIKRSCKCQTTTGIIARRKVTLRGDSQFSANVFKKTSIKIKLTIRQFLSALTKRSI